MRSILLCILILPLCFCANDNNLPRDAAKALGDFDNTKKSVMESYTKDIIKARDNMVKELEQQYAVEVKKGNLNGAAAIKAKKDCLKGNVIIHLKIDCPEKTEPVGGSPSDNLKSLLIKDRWQHDGKDIFAFHDNFKVYTEGKSGTWSADKDGKTVRLAWKEGPMETIVIDGTSGTYKGRPFIAIP